MIRVRELTETSQACPSQWEGQTCDDQPIYIRYRFGTLRVHIGPPHGGRISALDPEPLIEATLGDEWDGFIRLEQVIQATRDRIDWSLVE